MCHVCSQTLSVTHSTMSDQAITMAYERAVIWAGACRQCTSTATTPTHLKAAVTRAKTMVAHDTNSTHMQVHEKCRKMWNKAKTSTNLPAALQCRCAPPPLPPHAWPLNTFGRGPSPHPLPIFSSTTITFSSSTALRWTPERQRKRQCTRTHAHTHTHERERGG